MQIEILPRDIEFRVWDSVDKKMIYNLGFYNNNNFTAVMAIDKPLLSVIPMQYTTRKDINDNKIWEGDIVKTVVNTHEYDEKSGDVIAITKELISYIAWQNTGLWVVDEDFGWEGENLWDWNTIEVIGNIYEHPELLNLLNNA